MKLHIRMKALSDETRLHILNFLLFHEFNVNELVNLLQMGQSRVSRHLKILLDAGLVLARRDGLWVFYRCVENGDEYDFLCKFREDLEKEAVLQEDLVHAREFLNNKVREKRDRFDRLSENWEEIRSEIFGVFDPAEIVMPIQGLSVGVDLGCGTGTLIPFMLTKTSKVIGVDQSEGMLKRARTKFQGDDRVEFRLGQMEHIPLADGETDLAMMSMVLHHIEDPIEVFREVRRVLKQSGIFLLIDFQKHSNENLRNRYGDRWLGFEEKSLEAWLEKSGFGVVRKKKVPLSSGMTVFVWMSEIMKIK